MSFREKLRKAQEVSNSMVITGIDPVLNKMPKHLKELHNIPDDPEAVLTLPPIQVENFLGAWCDALVDATVAYVCGFKPNMAFFEAFGPGGDAALRNLILHIREVAPDRVIILDGKRGDIGDTAKKYAFAVKSRWQVDAVTANCYLGTDTLQPFFDADLGVIVLCKTSNPGSGDFQDVKLENGLPMYLHVADTLRKKFGHTGNLGLVTGATYPEQLTDVRLQVGNDVILLIPGIGKQGGDLAATIEANGVGLAVINVSSAIIFASEGEDFAPAAGIAARDYRDKSNALRQAA